MSAKDLNANAPLSKEDADKLKDLGAILAGKVVHSLLAITVKESRRATRDPNIENAILEKLAESNLYNYTGSIAIDIPDQKLDLKLQMSIVPKDYEIDIVLKDPRHSTTVYNQLGFLVQTAKTYYEWYKQVNVEFLTYIATYLPDVNFNTLVVADNRSMYFDQMVGRRIGLIGIYFNKDGTPFTG